MPTKAAIQAQIARLRSLPETPARLREIKALERCLGLEIRPAKSRKKADAKSSATGRRSVRKRSSQIEDEEDNSASSRPTKSSFHASEYLEELMGNRHKGMS